MKPSARTGIDHMNQLSAARLEEVDDALAAPIAGAPSLNGFLAAVEVQALRMAQIRLHHAEDAMDAVQDAMLRLVSHYADKPADEWPPLFWSILRRRIVDMQRKRKVRSIMLGWMPARHRENEDLPSWEPAHAGPGPLDTLADSRAMDALQRALQELPQRQFEAFSLRILNELDVAATARAMGCSQGSVKTHLSRARAALSEKLEDWR
mgnify:CR=1 FL=1